MSEELKPCPFCGGTAARSQISMLIIRCASCDIGFHCRTDPAAAWNRRASDLPSQAPDRERQPTLMPFYGAQPAWLSGITFGNPPNTPPERTRPHGCICPPGAEAGCRGSQCPRRAMEDAR